MLACAAVLLTFEACAHKAAEPALEVAEIAQPEPVLPQPVSRPAPAPAREKPVTPVRKKPVAPSPAAEPRASAPAIAPDQVIGLSEAETSELLGEPKGREDKAPAKVWRYAARGCDVTVIFYPELGSLTYRALNLEVRAESVSEGACLGGIASSRKSSA